ncbi:ABC transporter ATP-binding protein [Chloroflexota bacterium]
MANIVELKAVDMIYRGATDTQVLFDINLTFEEGSFNSLVGESGSGKSTLLNIIGTLDKPTSGEVMIAGNRINDLSQDRLAELRNTTIGFVFQFHYLLPEFTAIENVLMPYSISKKQPAKSVTKRADELFNMLNITTVRNNPANKMSGGQQQRTAIARALINNPKIILADEPTGNLDSENTATIYKIFREINQQYGTTFLIVTHDRRIAEQTDRIVEIKDGKIVVDIKK